MNLSEVRTHLLSAFDVKEISTDEYEITTYAEFKNNKKVVVYLVKEDGKYFLTDKKNTLSYMNEVYELKAPDVKSCISAVIKIYGFSITSGNIRVQIENEIDLRNKLFDFIMCVGQLVNMYAFFDQPV